MTQIQPQIKTDTSVTFLNQNFSPCGKSFINPKRETTNFL